MSMMSEFIRVYLHTDLNRHVQAFTRALDFNDSSPHDLGDVSPSSPRSPPAPLSPAIGSDKDKSRLQVPETWKYGPDNGALASSRDREREGGGTERVEKLTATSDFAVSRLVILSAPGMDVQLTCSAYTSTCLPAKDCHFSRMDISPYPLAVTGTTPTQSSGCSS